MSKVILKRLIDFYDEVQTTNKVSKPMVLSLEEFVGENLVTEKVNPNKLTLAPSATHVEDVKDALQEGINKYQALTAAPSLEDVMATFNTFINSVIGSWNYTLVELQRHVNTLTGDKVLFALTDEKIKYRYTDQNELIDVTTLGLDVVYSKYKDYFKDVYVAIHGSVDGYVLPEVENQEEINSTSIKYTTLMNIINSDECIVKATSVAPREFSIQDLIVIINNLPILIDKMAEYKSYIGSMIDPNSQESIETNQELLATYEACKKLNNAKDELFIDSIVDCLFKPNENTVPPLTVMHNPNGSSAN